MKINNIRLNNYRCFKELRLQFSEHINVFVGTNNSGKSSLLKCILDLQERQLTELDVRSTAKTLALEIQFSKGFLHDSSGKTMSEFTKFRQSLGVRNERILTNENNLTTNFVHSATSEPWNAIYPFLSKRKNGFDQSIHKNAAMSARSDLYYLIAKIDRLADVGHPKHFIYKKACEDVLGFYVHCQASDNGKRAGFLVNDFDFIPLESMGEGVGNILGMIVNLCIANDQIFLIEELENDIHPKALKSLLDLIVHSSGQNQFFVSTHSNVVVRNLGLIENTKIFSLHSKLENRIPTSVVTECIDQNQRQLILEDLGYELSDMGLWKGWLILEESSAETIINSFLIPWFTPSLIGKIKTFSTRGYHRAKERFDKLHEQFLYLHMTPAYKNKAWIILDDGDEETKEVEKLKKIYVEKHGWKSENFIKLSKHDFEFYYPINFLERVEITLRAGKEEKQKLKENLLFEVIEWINTNSERAQKELENSAAEIIEILKKIEKSLI